MSSGEAAKRVESQNETMQSNAMRECSYSSPTDFHPAMSILSCETARPITADKPSQAEQAMLILHQLIADLSLVQSRLGTSHELPDDYEQARLLGHNIRNKLQVLQMWDSLGLVDLPPHLKNMPRDLREKSA
jgi:hypothetical protein